MNITSSHSAPHLATSPKAASQHSAEFLNILQRRLAQHHAVPPPPKLYRANRRKDSQNHAPLGASDEEPAIPELVDQLQQRLIAIESVTPHLADELKLMAQDTIDTLQSQGYRLNDMT